mgnify:CR=1 FL=1
MRIAEIVQERAQEVCSLDVDVELVENPRAGETMVEEFGVDTSTVGEQLGWEPREDVSGSVRELLR